MLVNEAKRLPIAEIKVPKFYKPHRNVNPTEHVITLDIRLG